MGGGRAADGKDGGQSSAQGSRASGDQGHASGELMIRGGYKMRLKGTVARDWNGLKVGTSQGT
jgi:hypothetical protein